MKQIMILQYVLLLGMSLVLSGCEKEKENGSDENWETVTLDATAYDQWVYFSFSDNQEVSIGDFSSSTDWDIGFHRYDVRVNCGTAGPGQGGSLNAGPLGFETLTEAPADGYSLNDSIGVILESGVWEYTNVPGDTILATWLQFSGPPPTYTISDNIYVIRTADGKYVKLWLKDYFNDASKSGYVTMQYFYQKDGSRALE
jgi:hypothetical protein